MEFEIHDVSYFEEETNFEEEAFDAILNKMKYSTGLIHKMNVT